MSRTEGLNKLSIPGLDPSPLWYISKSGNDSPDCGRNEESACATFMGLWRHLVNGSSHGNNITVISDTDLIMKNMHLLSPDHQFTFQNSAWNLINITIINTTIEETELAFNGSNISLRIEDSLIRSSPMEFYGFLESDQPVVIRNCMFDEDTTTNNTVSSVLKSKSLLSFKGTNVQLYSCNFSGIRDYRQSMLCLEGNVTIMNVVASAIEGDFVITEQCNVRMTNSYFKDNNGSSLISVRGGKLIMENSHLINNTSKYEEIVYLKDTEAHVINSTLKGNWGGYAGGIRLYESNIHVINSTLTANKGEHAGGIDLYDSEAHLHNSIMTINQGERTGGIDLYNSEIHVINSTLIGNKGEYSGGIDLYYSKARVVNSTLIGNRGKYAGGIVLYNSEAHVMNSNLTGNKGRDAGAFQLLWYSHVTTTRCHILENIATDKGGAVNVNRLAEYQDHESLFTDNLAEEGGKKINLF